jgi:hypothetical protein
MLIPGVGRKGWLGIDAYSSASPHADDVESRRDRHVERGDRASANFLTDFKNSRRALD